MASPEPVPEALAARSDCAKLSEAIVDVENAHEALDVALAALARVRQQHVLPMALSDREDLSTAFFRVSVARGAIYETCNSLAALVVRLRQRWGVRP